MSGDYWSEFFDNVEHFTDDGFGEDENIANSTEDTYSEGDGSLNGVSFVWGVIDIR